MRRGWPPRPHDPRDRVPVAWVDDWEVRVFPAGSRHHSYFAREGMLHLQLWNPRRGLSVLTPSSLTAQRYEAFPVRAERIAVRDFGELRNALGQQLGVWLPGLRRQRALEQWFVEREMRQTTRAAMYPNAASPPPVLG